MTDIIPLKLVDIGSGQGRLKEFDVGDTIPASYLNIVVDKQTSPQDITAGRLLVQGAFGLGIDAPIFTGNIDVRATVPRGRVYCTTSTTGVRPTNYGELTTTINTNDYAHQEWVEITGTTGKMRRWWRDTYGTSNVWSSWYQYVSADQIPGAVGAWILLAPYVASGINAYLASPYFRLNGDRVEFRGGVGKTGGWGGTSNLIATMPAGYRPAYGPSSQILGTLNTGGLYQQAECYVDNTGAIQLGVSGGGPTGGGVSLEQLSYTVGA